MTRLDVSSEPSMEDILASIRKIIAEDPPGSRPSPAPVQRAPAGAALSSFGRGLFQDPLFQSDRVSEPIAALEPYLKASPAKADVSGFAATPFFPKVSETKSPESRIEPEFAPLAETKPSPSVAPEGAPVALSVDAQLSDLLGDALPIEPSAAVAPAVTATAHAEMTKPAVDYIAKLMARPNEAMASQISTAANAETPAGPETRAGFTVSRDGFVPAETSIAAERDPFDFDLGPSPFQTKAIETKPAAVETVVALVPFTEPAPALQIDEPTPASVQFVMPSIAATIPPAASTVELAVKPAVQGNTAEAGVIIAMAPAESVEVKAAAAPLAEVAASPNDAIETVVPSLDYAIPVTAAAIINAHEAQPIEQTEFTQRTMEETVADLLRPMLRSWLAEHMPKIVERALRRELSEEFHSEHKTAAE